MTTKEQVGDKGQKIMAKRLLAVLSLRDLFVRQCIKKSLRHNFLSFATCSFVVT